MMTPVICHRGMGLLEILRCLEHTHIRTLLVLAIIMIHI